MQLSFAVRCALSLAVLASSGCYATMHPLDGCPPGGVCSLRECDLGTALDRFCTGQCFNGSGCKVDCGCEIVDPCDCDSFECASDGCEVPCDEIPCEVCPTVCQGCLSGLHLRSMCPLRNRERRWRLGQNVEPGPPPVTYQVPLPPKLLPVPTRPVFSAVNLHGPDPSTATVEMGWGPQLSHPSRD